MANAIDKLIKQKNNTPFQRPTQIYAFRSLSKINENKNILFIKLDCIHWRIAMIDWSIIYVRVFSTAAAWDLDKWFGQAQIYK